MRGFYYKVTSSNTLSPKMWSILSVLRMTRSLALPKLIVEANLKGVIDIIHKGVATNPVIQFILKEIIIFLLKRDWEVMLVHIQRSRIRVLMP